uniref:RNA-directed RNA polymerase catalytic subunit n=1 Tax=Ceratitis capitata TaxID=7213 RepID=W8CDN0_CERCA
MEAKEFQTYFKRNYKLNSLIGCTAVTDVVGISELTPNKSTLSPEYTDGLHMCNSLYLYTNPPPVGYGTPAPKAAESVLRAYQYNRKISMKTLKIGNWEIEDTTIHEERDFPINQITGNYIPSACRMMSDHYYFINQSSINAVVRDTYEWLMKTKADEMSRGRQTWDPESEKSITCAKAYSRTIEIVKDNLNTNPGTMLELLHCYINLLSLDSLKIKKRTIKFKSRTIFDVIRRCRYQKTKRIIVLRNYTIHGNDEVFKYIINYTRSFCSYIKHKERGKKDRRAIASGNIILRTLLKIIEEFHLRLSKKVEGNTIGIGGDQKKSKISTELKTCTIMDTNLASFSVQGTEDATKWNECLTPSMFALMHHSFFKYRDNEENDIHGMKELLLKISDFTFFIMSIKRIHLGPGLIIENENHYNRKNWSEYTKEELNCRTYEWFSKVKLSDMNYIEASPGFLMGMLNAASTTVGLLPSNYISIDNAKIKTLRSSDDSMSVYVGGDSKSLISVIFTNYLMCKKIGINMSTKKTLFFREGFGEYTSWYQDGEFVGQSGTETASIRPGGMNPQEDFNNIAIQTAVLMRTHIINAFGAAQRLLLGVNNVRRLYRIKSKEDSELSSYVRFLADGGKIPWTIETLLIDESTIRYSHCKTDQDFSYFYKIMDPNNPFVQPPEDNYMYSRDTGTLVKTSYEVPLNIYNYVRKSNYTINNQTSLLEAEKEKSYKLAYKIATMIDPSLFLTGGSKKTMLNVYLEANIRVQMFSEELSEGDNKIINDAIAKLNNIDQMENDDDDLSDIDIY